MKNLILIVVFALFSTLAHSQKGLHLGVKGAPQSTWMFNADDSDDPEWLFQNTLRFSFGASVNYFFSDKIGLGVDFLYSAQGQKFEFEFAGVRTNGFTKLSYFKIPVLFHYHSSSESTALFYLNAGPQFSILTSGQTEVEVPIINGINITSKDNYDSLNIGAVLALGAGFNLTDFLMLTAGLRFDYAFTDAEDKSFGLYSLDPDRSPNHNATAGLEIGLRYVLGSN